MNESEEFDFEIDTVDLPDATTGPVPTGPPSLIIDNLFVNYRVFGARAMAGGAPPRSALSRAIRRLTEGNIASVAEVEAVRGVSLVAHQGEAIGIIGINGSGKSTLLRAAAGLIPPTRGAVYVSSEPSLLGVNAVLMRQLSGERNILIGGLALGLSLKEIREKFDEIVEFAGLGEFVYMPMKAYSSGMAARLRFAISSVATPDILMIDEALATGDADFRQKSKDRIEKIREQAGTIFLVSHSLETIKRMCSRVIWLHKGLLLKDGDPEEVTEAYRSYIRAIRAAKASGEPIPDPPGAAEFHLAQEDIQRLDDNV
ncbi:ABC transporter ATP-binding protein [Sanguibacter sp. Z1732]|uniref:ABC transporter ATP-binding protein n=1 Tax=Sanguibacter sp. Z1732 TaxID=3435412 RepID=UPI003D9C8EF1